MSWPLAEGTPNGSARDPAAAKRGQSAGEPEAPAPGLESKQIISTN